MAVSLFSHSRRHIKDSVSSTARGVAVVRIYYSWNSRTFTSVAYTEPLWMRPSIGLGWNAWVPGSGRDLRRRPCLRNTSTFFKYRNRSTCSKHTDTESQQTVSTHRCPDQDGVSERGTSTQVTEITLITTQISTQISTGVSYWSAILKKTLN